MPQPVFARPGSIPNMIRWSPRTPALSFSENNALDSNAVAAHTVDAAKAKPFQLERPHVERSGSQACRINAGLYKLRQRRRMLPARFAYQQLSVYYFAILLLSYQDSNRQISRFICDNERKASSKIASIERQCSRITAQKTHHLRLGRTQKLADERLRFQHKRTGKYAKS